MTEEEFKQRRIRSSRITLRVLLVMSFIFSGSYLLLGLEFSFASQMIGDIFTSYSGKMAEEYHLVIDRELAKPQWYHLLCTLLNATSIVGLVMMWNLRKNGFHCYTLSKLLLMLMPILFMGRSYVAIGDIMIAILFIAYYFFLLKNLGAFNPPDASSAPVPPESDSPDV